MGVCVCALRYLRMPIDYQNNYWWYSQKKLNLKWRHLHLWKLGFSIYTQMHPSKINKHEITEEKKDGYRKCDLIQPIDTTIEIECTTTTSTNYPYKKLDSKKKWVQEEVYPAVRNELVDTVTLVIVTAPPMISNALPVVVALLYMNVESVNVYLFVKGVIVWHRSIKMTSRKYEIYITIEPSIILIVPPFLVHVLFWYITP